VEYRVVNTTGNQSVYDQTEAANMVPGNGGSVTLKKTFPTSALPPGVYQITVTVRDQISKQTLTPTAKFVVE
jgi:hypothetical protein